MQEFNEFLIFIDQYLGSSSWFVPLLLGTGVFFTFYLRFPQIRYFSFALKVVRGKFDKKDDQGDTSHFQALTTALSGTVGTGNIAGVAFAIHLGKPCLALPSITCIPAWIWAQNFIVSLLNLPLILGSSVWLCLTSHVF